MKVTDKHKIIVGGIIVGTAFLNILMCLNLYRQLGNLEYKLNQLDSNLYIALQSVSRDVWDLKNAKQINNKTGEFE